MQVKPSSTWRMYNDEKAITMTGASHRVMSGFSLQVVKARPVVNEKSALTTLDIRTHSPVQQTGKWHERDRQSDSKMQACPEVVRRWRAIWGWTTSSRITKYTPEKMMDKDNKDGREIPDKFVVRWPLHNCDG